MAGPRKTRSKAAPKATDASLTEEAVVTKQIPVRDERPPKVFVLPQDVSREAKIVSLSSPANGCANRYLFCPDKGLFEFTRITTPKSTPRSWLLNRESEAPSQEQGRDETSTPTAKDRIVSQPDLFVATALDELYFLLPILCSAQTNAPRSAGTKHLFLTLDDHIERCGIESSHFNYVVNNGAFRERLESRAAIVCDVQEAGDEKMFRLSDPRLARDIYSKARRMIKNGLPPSMEERFVRRQLQAPVSNAPIVESDIASAQNGLTESSQSQDNSSDSQVSSRRTEASQADSVATLTPATSVATDIEAEAGIPVKEEGGASESVYNSLRFRTATDFLLKSYIPPYLREPLREQLTVLAVADNDLEADFKALDEYLAKLAASRAEAVVLRTMSDNVSRKRTANSEFDEEQADARAEKKRKKEEEDLKEKNKSRAIKQLKKADISGMKTMQSFFQKAAPKKK